MTSPTSTKVIIVGAGIAGPVLALILKDRGYSPVIYERTQKGGDAGLSIMLQPNGLRVLSLIPALADPMSSLPGQRVSHTEHYSFLPLDITQLVALALPPQEDGLGLLGIQRAKFNEAIVSLVDAAGIPLHWGRKVVGVEDNDKEVKVLLEDGSSDTASFVVACDGIHSTVRAQLFGHEEATYTGLTQTGGFSPTPDFMKGRYPMINMYGDNAHMILYPESPDEISWAITQREPEHKETWRAMDDAAQDQFRKGQFANMPFGGGDLVRTAKKFVKYGLYDRPELKTWYKGRIVLLGDAVHATSPHLGQGANSAFEDVYHLTRCLLKHNPDGTSPSTEVLTAIFAEYEGMRLERTSMLVREARKLGDVRVTSGEEKCKDRNEFVKKLWNAPDVVKTILVERAKGPFVMGASEI